MKRTKTRRGHKSQTGGNRSDRLPPIPDDPLPDGAKLFSRALGNVDLDPRQLRRVCAVIDGLPRNPGYAEYAFGNWFQAWLANRSGDHRDLNSEEYQGSAKWTELGERVPYLKSVVERTFKPELIQSARIFYSGGNGGILTHRDYTEFEQGFTRIHIPLRTDSTRCFNSEGGVVFHMPVGQIVFLDGRCPHSAVAYVPHETPRIHLAVDFLPGTDFQDLFADASCYSDRGRLSVVDRPPMPVDRREYLVGLGRYMHERNVRSMLELFNHEHFRFRMPAEQTYVLLFEAAELSGSQGLMWKATELADRFLGRGYLTF